MEKYPALDGLTIYVQKKKGWSDDHPHADYSDSFADIAEKIDVFQNHFV